MCLRSTFLFLCVLFASLYLTLLLESRAFRSNDASEFWLFRKLMSSRAIDTQWWTTTTTKSRIWKTTIVRIVFDVVVYQLIVVLRVDQISLKTFMRKRAIVRFYLTVWDRERSDWEDADEIDKETIQIHEKKLFFMRNIAKSLRILVKRKILKIHDLNLNFEK